MAQSLASLVPSDVHRRAFLGHGVLGLCAALGSRPFVQAADVQPVRRADACILVLLGGGPSHLDMWDPKPNAPAEIRGPFETIATSVTGLRLTEHLPKLARQLHHCALVRSLHHHVRGAHTAAAYMALTGVHPEDRTWPASADDHPAIGSVVAMSRRASRFPLPYVWLPYRTTEVDLHGKPIPGMLGGFLGAKFDPFFIVDDPSDPDFIVPEFDGGPEIDSARLSGRMSLLEALDRSGMSRDEVRWRELRQQVQDLQGTSALRQVFAVSAEPASIRDAYGQNRFGSSLLLARRLIEAGCGLVCVTADKNLNTSWDTHFNNFDILKKDVLPRFDAGMSALLQDLADRGLLGSTLVMAFGEFGRSPKIGDGDPTGRAHWPDCYTALLAGGGIKGGVAFGRSDRFGAYPLEDAVPPADLLATAYQCLGVAQDSHLADRFGRPVRVALDGNAIKGVLE